jgi:hypothetical protein
MILPKKRTISGNEITLNIHTIYLYFKLLRLGKIEY